MSQPGRENHDSDRTANNQYLDKYRPAKSTVDEPVLATENERYEIDDIPLPNKYARDYIGYQIYMNRLSESTIPAYTYRLNEFLQFIENVRETSLFSADKTDIEVFLRYCIEECRNRRKTLEGKLAPISNLIGHIHVECNPPTPPELSPIKIKQIDLDDFKGIPPAIEREALPRDDVQLLLNQSVGRYPQRNRLINRMFYETGIRNSDLRRLEIENIYFDKKAFEVKNSKWDVNYTSAFRSDLSLEIQHWLNSGRPAMLGDRESDYLIPTRQNDKFEDASGMTAVVRKTAEAAGIQRKLLNQDGSTSYYRVTPHALRHSIATHLDHEDLDEDLIQLFLGHTRSESKEPYIHGKSKDEKFDQIRTTLHHL